MPNTSDRSLPPNVKGKVRGCLAVCVTELRLRRRSFNGINVRFIWWGESVQSSAVIRIDTTTPQTVRYTILTTPHLFTCYLENCESIELRFTSARTNLQIGTAFVKLPPAFAQRTPRSWHQIFSPANTHLGDILVDFDLKFRPASSAPVSRMLPLNNNCKEERDAGMPMKTVQKSPRMVDENTILDYLTGQPLTDDDECDALRDFCTGSPTQNIVDFVAKDLTGRAHKVDTAATSGWRDDIQEHITLGGRKKKHSSRKSEQKSKITYCNNETQTSSVSLNEFVGAVPAQMPRQSSSQEATNNLNTQAADDKLAGANQVQQFNEEKASHQTLYGLFYIDEMKDVASTPDSSFFVQFKSFWQVPVISTTRLSQNYQFNCLEIFILLCNDKFVEESKNNHLALELWRKIGTAPEQLIGITHLPLHQFYIAFRNEQIREHLRSSQLPVISHDGWSTIASPTTGLMQGQIRTILAIGTKEQIDFVHTSRVRPLSEARAGTPIAADNPSTSETKKDLIENFLKNVSDLLQTKMGNNNTKASQQQQEPIAQSNLKSTADLMNVVESALNMSPAQSRPASVPTPRPSPAIVAPLSATKNSFKCIVEVEKASNLEKIHSRPTKKLSKRGKAKSVPISRPVIEIEPSTYATVPVMGNASLTEVFMTTEGPVYCTPIVERSCSPEWYKKFEISFPDQVMTDKNRNVVIKLWRKSSTRDSTPKLIANPAQDTLIGFSMVSLNLFLSGFAEISGWYNLIDIQGKIVGQLKLNIKPLDDLAPYRVAAVPMSVPLQAPPAETIEPDFDLTNTSLSRALKRKFTELEEITQRLKSRLYDVMGDEGGDDEFERDLNTICTEDDELPWLSDGGNSEFADRANEFQNTIGSSSLHNEQRYISGCSDGTPSKESDRIGMISDALRDAVITEFDKLPNKGN